MESADTGPHQDRPRRKVALVTGAAGGIAAHSAALLARDGFDVAVAGRDLSGLENTARRCQGHGARTSLIPVDLTQHHQVGSMVTKAVGDLGGLDVLVNEAGDAGSMVPLLETRPESFDRLVRRNVSQSFWVLQAAGEVMAGQGSGAVVNVASVAALVSAPALSAYGAGEAALVSLTRTAAVEWGPAGVRVNAVAPGWVKTDANRVIWENPQAQKAMVARAALGRWGEAAEVAELVSFLASDRASYVTGQVLVADGGLTVAAF